MKGLKLNISLADTGLGKPTHSDHVDEAEKLKKKNKEHLTTRSQM